MADQQRIFEREANTTTDMNRALLFLPHARLFPACNSMLLRELLSIEQAQEEDPQTHHALFASFAEAVQPKCSICAAVWHRISEERRVQPNRTNARRLRTSFVCDFTSSKGGTKYRINIAICLRCHDAPFPQRRFLLVSLLGRYFILSV